MTMISFFNKFKIPTLLGLGVIIFGIAVGIYLILQEQQLITKATPDQTPQNITLTNIEDRALTISWQTTAAVTSFISYGQNSPDEQTALDERDNSSPKPHTIHYVTVKNLQPKTTYQFKIVTGKLTSDTFQGTTAAFSANQNGFSPVIGSVLDNDKPVEEAIAYLSISGAVVQSALVKSLGNFLIPLSFIRKQDLSDIFKPTEDDIAKLTIIAEKGTVSATFKLNPSGLILPPLKLGQNLDLTNILEELKKFDLNKDGLINAADHAIILQNFGPPSREASAGAIKNPQADLNSDGVVNQKDLDLMAKKINK